MLGPNKSKEDVNECLLSMDDVYEWHGLFYRAQTTLRWRFSVSERGLSMLVIAVFKPVFPSSPPPPPPKKTKEKKASPGLEKLCFYTQPTFKLYFNRALRIWVPDELWNKISVEGLKARQFTQLCSLFCFYILYYLPDYSKTFRIFQIHLHISLGVLCDSCVYTKIFLWLVKTLLSDHTNPA